VIGATIRRGGAMYASFEAGHPVSVEETPSIADSLQGGIGLDNRHTFDLCRLHLDRLVPLEECEIETAMAAHFLLDRLVVEGAAAAPLAAALAGAELGDRACLVLTGAAVDPLNVAELARKHRSRVAGLRAGS
jgi:threonine dehydratase